MKKLLCILLSFVMLLSLAPAALASEEASKPAPAEKGIPSGESAEWPALDGAFSGTCGKDLSWTLEDGVLTISGTGKMSDYSLFDAGAPWSPYKNLITSVIIGDGVTHVGEGAFISCTNITSITIPASVESFGYSFQFAFSDCPGLKTAGPIGGGYDYEYGWTESIPPCAFAGCDGLESVTFPDGLTEIGSKAFTRTGVTEIMIPAGITSIGEAAFKGCSSLEAINVAAENEYYSSLDGVLFNKDMTALLRFPGGKTGAYRIPSGLESIQSDAFSYCKGLESVTIPDDITVIGESMFFQSTSLESVFIPDSVTSIERDAFSGCASLKELTIPDSVTSIGSGAFNNCVSLKELAIPDSVSSIDMAAFYDCAGLTKITLSAGLTVIEDFLFRGCSCLESVTIPNSVMRIGGYAFFDCASLKELMIPDSVSSIGSGAFYGCAGLTEITLPDGVTSIEGSVFAECSSLTSVTIPTSVTGIGFIAFADCTSLTDVYYGGSESDWANIEIGDSNESLFNARIHFTEAGSASEPTAPEAPVLEISEDAKTASVTGDFTGLYARVALVLDNSGVSGLYVTQAMINDDGTIVIPEFKVPGLKVKGVNVSLVPTLADIQSSTPNVQATASKML